MKKLYKNSLYIMVAGALVASCADYNVTDDFHADPDPSITQPYADLNAVKSYIDRDANPNLTIGASLDVADFNKQALEHSAVITNFDNVSFGKSLMSGTIVSDKGVMNFINMMDLLEHMEEIGGEIYGSPIFANTNQPDGWINMLTAPIEIPVDYVEGKTVDFSTYPLGNYTGTVKKGTVKIVKYDGQNMLNLPSTPGIANIVEGFTVDPSATYTATFWAKADKDASFFVNFSGNKILGTATKDGKWKLPAGKLTKVVVEAKAAEGVTDGYLEIEMVRGSSMNIQKVEVGYFPDNHRKQTDKEINDTIHYAINAWTDRLMEINEGRIKSFDLIDEPIDNTTLLENEMYDLKHSTSKIFWQDILGSENYAPAIAQVAREAFEKHGGNLADLKFFISEIGLEDTKKMESLNYWLGIWDKNGANIDGINAKVNLVCYENADKLENNKKEYENLLRSLAATGKLIRVSNFDIKYVNEKGTSVSPTNITDEQRQKLADYNAYALKAYISIIPKDKQAGINKSNLTDTTSDAVGIWTPNKTKDWVRNATYKAWCDALGGK